MAGPNRGSQAEELLQCYRKGKRARLETTANIEDTEVVDMPTSSNQAISTGYQRSAGSEQSDAAPHSVQAAKDATTNAQLPAFEKSLGTSSLGGHKFYGRRSKSKQWNAMLKQIATANKTFILAEEEARRQRAARSASGALLMLNACFSLLGGFYFQSRFWQAHNGAPCSKTLLKVLQIRSARPCFEYVRISKSRSTSRLISPCRSVIWQVFPTQEMAFTFADAHGSKDAEAARLAVLSVEDASIGRRRFLVTTFDVFWKRSAISILLQ
jgi:hypothetical protein